MKIAIGSDHAGFELKESLRVFIESLGHEIIDVGTDSTESVDYPDYAEKVAVEVITGRADRGVMLCGSGVGASVA
ncbi:MAG: RpiB/LacA/LacB family sugar-phosphate isomerase, partial [Phycisphaeraceae bacterium]|nr:RpiB/LacA/LacB family sugar-phosphate isomerase [Phycisphaeraceae bacterium]